MNGDYQYSEPAPYPFCTTGHKLYCSIQATGYRRALAKKITSSSKKEKATLVTLYGEKRANYSSQFGNHRAACARCENGWTFVCASDDELEHLHGK